MALNPNAHHILNACVEEGATQTDDLMERCTHGLDSVVTSEIDAVWYSRNPFLHFVCATFLDMMPHSKVNKSTQTFVNPVVSKGEKLAREVIFYFLQEELDLVQDDRLSLCLRNIVTEMLQKNDILFSRMVNSLRITPATARLAFTDVVNQLFSSGGVTWGRIVAFYAFASRLAVYCKERDMVRLSRSIPLFMTQFIEEKIAPFVEKHGGWGQLCAEFPTEECVNDKVWRYLLMTSVVMGIAALGYSFAKL